MNGIIPIQTNIHYNPIQALINLPIGLNNPKEIKTEDYHNFVDIPNNSLLIIDSEYLGIINSITRNNRVKFMIEHHSILPNELRVSNLRAKLNEYFTYNKVANEEIPVYVVGYKLWNIYKSIIDTLHITCINSQNSQEINDFFNELTNLKFEKSIAKHITTNETLTDDPEVISVSTDYMIYNKQLEKL